MPILSNNRTILQASFDQGVAGSTDLAAAVTGQRIYVVAVCISASAAGTVKFQENAATDLTGAMPIGTSPVLLAGNGNYPILQTNTVSLKLNIVSVTGAVKGYIRYYTE